MGIGKDDTKLKGYDIHKEHQAIKDDIEFATENALATPLESYRLAKKAVDKAKKLELSVLQGYGLYALALACRSLGKHIEAFEYANEALKVFKVTNNDEMKMNLHLIIGILYFYAGAYYNSLHSMYLARGLAVQLKNYRKLCSVLNNIGEIHRKSENYKEALSSYREAARIAETHSQFDHLGAVMSNVGEVEIVLGMYSEATKTFEIAHSHLEYSKDTVLKSELLYRKGKLALAIGEYEKAWDLIVKSKSELDNMENKYYIIDALMLQFEYFKASGNNIKGLEVLEEAQCVAKEYGADHQLVKVLDLFYHYYEDIGDYKKALEYFKRHQFNLQKIEADHLILKLKMLMSEQSDVQVCKSVGTINGFATQEIRHSEARIVNIMQTLRTMSESSESYS